MKKHSKRLFLAIEIPPMKALVDVAEQLSTACKKGDISMVQNHNYHLTLRFLGDTENAKIDPIILVLIEKLRTQPAFEIEITGLGVFPNEKSPRVWWANVVDKNQNLERLSAVVNNTLDVMGFPPSQVPFKPHLTLARIKSQSVAKALNELTNTHRATVWGRCHVSRINLYQSTLTPKGPIYKSLYGLTLSGDALA